MKSISEMPIEQKLQRAIIIALGLIAVLDYLV